MRLLPLLALSIALAACGAEPAREKSASAPAGPEKQAAGRLDRSKAGSAAPEATFKDPAGAPTSLAAFRGKPLLVNLWATWCAPCIVEMPSLDALAERDPRLQILALSQDMEGQEKVDAFFAERKFRKLEPYVDSDLAVMSALKVDTLPTTILYDSEGREVWRMTGMEEWTGPRAAALLMEAASAER